MNERRLKRIIENQSKRWQHLPEHLYSECVSLFGYRLAANPSSPYRALAKSCYRDVMRSQARSKVTLEADIAQAITEHGYDDTDLIELLTCLDDEQAQAIKLFYVEGLTKVQISKLMGLSIPTLNKIILKALTTLKKELEYDDRD